MMTAYERVCRAISFCNPDRVPIWRINKDPQLGDVYCFDIRIQHELPGTGDGYREYLSEWGYVFRNLDDGTMGLPCKPVLASMEEMDRYAPPDLDPQKRFRGLGQFMEASRDYYRLPMLAINGFNTYTFLRGFDNAMTDLYVEPERCARLLDKIFNWEKELITLCAQSGFHGYHIGDDWGTQHTLLIAPRLWRQVFSPRYRNLIDHAHRLNLHIWFHSCGNITQIVPDLYEAGVDVINLAQPNVLDIYAIGVALTGKACFLVPISYQTTSLKGTREDIYAEAARLINNLGSRNGGFIGYVEEYRSIGMSDENYQNCVNAFRACDKYYGNVSGGESMKEQSDME